MKCESCEAEATVHITEVFGDALVAERHLCVTCAQQMGLPASAGITDAVHRIRKLSAFIKANNRMPSQEEFKLLGGAGGMSSSAPGAKGLQKHVSYLEALASFLERHGRPPTEEELPDPF